MVLMRIIKTVKSHCRLLITSALKYLVLKTSFQLEGTQNMESPFFLWESFFPAALGNIKEKPRCSKSKESLQYCTRPFAQFEPPSQSSWPQYFRLGKHDTGNEFSNLMNIRNGINIVIFVNYGFSFFLSYAIVVALFSEQGQTDMENYSHNLQSTENYIEAS